MKDKNKTKGDLLHELDEMRQRVSILEKAHAHRYRDSEKNRHLASFPQLNPNPVIEINVKGEITFCNRAAYEVLKRLGLAEDASVFIPPDLNNVLKAGALDSRLYREVRIGGRVLAENIHMATRGRTLRIYAHDITEQVRATEELKGSERSAIGTLLSSPLILWPF